MVHVAMPFDQTNQSPFEEKCLLPSNQETMLATFQADEVLIRLFQRHFSDPVTALLRLERHLTAVPLSFDLKAQVREMDYPAMPGLPDGMPSFIYYYLPNSGWGSNNPVPVDPLDASFVKCSDGALLNFGCPVRLLRALDVVARLRPIEQVEAKASLLNPTQHFAAIEELLWTTVWRMSSDLRRGGTLAGAKGDVDWVLKSCDFPLYLEAKFRPSDWPRLTDQGTFAPMPGSFLGKAAHKFPNPPQGSEFYLVGITAYDNLTHALCEQIGTELKIYPQIHGIIFRSLIQTTHVLSLNSRLCDHVFAMLAMPSARDYPSNYFVATHTEQRDKRLIERTKGKAVPDCPANSGVFVRGLCAVVDGPVFIPGDLYRLDIDSRGSDGEPRFHTIPKFLATDKPPQVAAAVA
jgi:hypothetical protein